MFVGSRPGKEWKEYERALYRGDHLTAMRIAKAYGMPLDLRDMLSLTIAAGKAGDPIFDPMGVRWIIKVDEKGKTRLRLHEVEWLARTFRNLQAGDRACADELWRFLATGRLP